MILDRRENAKRYLGISPALDVALRFVSGLEASALAVGTQAALCDDVTYSVGDPTLTHREMCFEYHRQHIDIHVPVTGTERIALCLTPEAPDEREYIADRDVGFFAGQPVNTVDVPAGWFCLCFPQDAHVPCIGDNRAIVKVVVKVRA